MKKMCYLLTMGLLAGSLTVPVFAASDAETDKKWTIATDTVFKPFEYTDDSGNFVGIDVDVLDAIAKDQGFEYELKSLGWDASIAACQAGQADGMIAGASITDERKESGWLFSDGYYNATQSMTVQKETLPTVAGVVVVAEGGGNPAAVSEISESVQALLKVEPHRIRVVKMCSREESE